MRAPPARSLRSRQGYIWLHAFFTASQPLLQGCPGPTWGDEVRSLPASVQGTGQGPHATWPGGVAMLRLQRSPCLDVGSLLMGQDTKPRGEKCHWGKARHAGWHLLEEGAGEGAEGSQWGHPTPNPQTPFPAASLSPGRWLSACWQRGKATWQPCAQHLLQPRGCQQKMPARHQEWLRESYGNPPWGSIRWAGSLQGCFLFLESSEFPGTEAGSNGAGSQSYPHPE